jgi:hypothetical protein
MLFPRIFKGAAHTMVECSLVKGGAKGMKCRKMRHFLATLATAMTVITSPEAIPQWAQWGSCYAIRLTADNQPGVSLRLCSSTRRRALKITMANGGSVITTEEGKPCEGTGDASTFPILPQPEPP